MKSSRTPTRQRSYGFRGIIILILALFGTLFLTRSSFMQSGAPQKPGTRSSRSERLRKVVSNPIRKPAGAVGVKSVASPKAIAAAGNYVLTDTTSASLTDMSTATDLIGPDQDDRSSQVTLIGFDFFFDGVRQDRFSVSTNGTLRLGKLAVSDLLTQPLGSADESVITAYGADQRTHIGDGRIRYLLTGTEGNRVLVVEWLNMQSNFHDQGTADLTYQVRLSETTGTIEFIYGSMTMSVMGAADLGPQIGFSSGSDPGMVGSINAQVASRSFDGASNAPVSNAYPAGPIDVLTSVADGSRRSFLLSPPAAETPATLNFTAVTTTSMNLSWPDTSNELGYAIYISTDGGVTFTFREVVIADTTLYVASGLRGNTVYFWRVYAVTEGGTAFVGDNQTTSTPAANASVGSGAWSSPATWSTGSVPNANDAVTIASPDIVTIQSDEAAYSVVIPTGAKLEFDATTPHTLTVGADVTVDPGGTFDSNIGGTQTLHILDIGGDLTNNGSLDFSANTNTSGATIIFTGTADQAFSGSGANNIRAISLQKGSQSSLVNIHPDNFNVQGVTSDTVPGWLELFSGTVEISGTFSMNSRTFNAISYEIPLNSGFWLNNPNYVVEGQGGNANIMGLLRITQSTFNVGATNTNTVNTATGTEINIEGGVVNIAGRFLGTNNGANPNGANAIVYNQSVGDFNVATVGNTTDGPNNASFTLSAESTFNMSGGNITLVQSSTAGTQFDYVNNATFVADPGNQGTLRVGNAFTASATVFYLRGKIPNFVIDNLVTDKVAVVNGQVNLRGTTFMPVNATFIVDNAVCMIEGPTFENNGAIIGDAENSHLYFLGGNGPTTYSGTGVVFQPLTFFQVDNAAGVTLAPGINQVIVTEVDIFNGVLNGSDHLTIGTGGASSGVVQLGDIGISTVTGFDMPPIFNVGTGGLTLRYAPEPTGRTTGNEMPPSRTLDTLEVTNPNNIDIFGGDVVVVGEGAGALVLNGGRVITNVNTLYFNSVAGTVVRTTGYVDGFFRKSFKATGNKDFEVGTANGYSPVSINATAGNFPVDFQVKANQGPQPNVVSPASSLQRYWNLDPFDTFTADITLNYLDIDVPSTVNEGTLVIAKFNGAWTFPGGTVDTAANTATVNNISSFSSWTLTTPLAPTNAPATISGSVTRADGSPLGGVSVNLSGGQQGSERTITDASGRYRFDSVDSGEFYTVTPGLANYSFSPASQSFSLIGNKTDGAFTANATAETANPLNGGDFFVRQQYLDFLGREPDQAGWLYWSDQIATCGADQACANQKRLDVSAAFFMSDEFQRSGDYIYRLYRAGLGRQLTYAEFTDDHLKVIGGADLETMRTQFADEFVQRPDFAERYQSAVLAETFVDALLQGTLADTQVDMSSQRASLIAAYNDGADLNHSRSAVLRAVAERPELKTAVYNSSFVLMEYFGYLRRDMDQDGFAFWVGVLNTEQGSQPGNYRGMVCSFVTSAEYQRRFSQVVTRSNADCAR